MPSLAMGSIALQSWWRSARHWAPGRSWATLKAMQGVAGRRWATLGNAGQRTNAGQRWASPANAGHVGHVGQRLEELINPRSYVCGHSASVARGAAVAGAVHTSGLAVSSHAAGALQR